MFGSDNSAILRAAYMISKGKFLFVLFCFVLLLLLLLLLLLSLLLFLVNLKVPEALRYEVLLRTKYRTWIH